MFACESVFTAANLSNTEVAHSSHCSLSHLGLQLSIILVSVQLIISVINQVTSWIDWMFSAELHKHRQRAILVSQSGFTINTTVCFSFELLHFSMTPAIFFLSYFSLSLFLLQSTPNFMFMLQQTNSKNVLCDRNSHLWETVSPTV